MISYAQTWEDVWLRRAFPGKPDGYYVDVGANDPVDDSVTKHFYDCGWHGINIEPQGSCFERLREARPRDINLHLGLSSKEGTLTFYEVPSRDGWSTFSRELADHFREKNLQVNEHVIPVKTLAWVFDHFVDRTIDFLKIDVEGHEHEVVEGGDWRRWRPRVVLIEASDPSKWEPLLLSANYLLANFDGINRYYVRGEEPDLLAGFRVPVNGLDDFISYRHQYVINSLEQTIDCLKNAAGEPARAIANLHLQIEGLHKQLALYSSLQPVTLGVARRLQRIFNRFPRAARAVSRVAGVAGT
jgi:FkbM family methyltransferase